MEKRRIIIADTDPKYILPLQTKFAETFYGSHFDIAELEIITERGYFCQLLSSPQTADILIVSESLYDPGVRRHNFGSVFILTEKIDDLLTDEVNVCRIYKYTSLRDIFSEIVSKCPDAFRGIIETHAPQLVVVSSACGGTGKTSVALGLCAHLSKNNNRVLYINAERLHTFQRCLQNSSPISSNDVYISLMNAGGGIYSEIRHVIRSELFSYLPPFKAALMSLGLKPSVFEQLAVSAKLSGDYSYVIVDTDSVFDGAKAGLFEAADKVLIVTKQDEAAVYATGILASNINDVNSGKYIFICNDFSGERANALSGPESGRLSFCVSEYIERSELAEGGECGGLAASTGIQKTAYLIQ